MRVPVRIAVCAVAATLTTPLWACSICRCGDPTFNALGFDGIAQTGLRLALDWDQLKKTQGTRGGDFSSVRERRSTLLLAYGFSERFTAFARVPYGERELVESHDGEPERISTSGLADPEFYGQVRLWSSPFEGDVGARASVFATFGMKTDWGANDVSRGGERLDEHAQSGTGAMDWFGGVSGFYQLNAKSVLFASAQYRHTARNDFGYRYGRVSLLNAAYEYKLAPRWDTVLELNYRDSGRDLVSELHEHGAGEAHTHTGLDGDTGGSITYITPRVLFDAGRGWVARVSAQIPLSQSGLNGEQREKSVVNLGITRLF